MKKLPKYNLYMGKIQALPPNVKYSYYNSNTKFILLYTDNKPECGDFRLIAENLHDKLQSEEKKWLFSVKTLINAEHIKENAKELADFISEFAETFEKELKTEKENFEKVNNEQ